MKRFFVSISIALALAAGTVSLSSCSKDDDEVVTPDSPNTPETQIDDQRIIGTWEGSFWGDTFILKFTSDGKVTETIDGDSETFSFTLKDNTLVITPDKAVINNILGSEIQVSFSGSKMTLASQFYTIEFTKK